MLLAALYCTLCFSSDFREYASKLRVEFHVDLVATICLSLLSALAMVLCLAVTVLQLTRLHFSAALYLVLIFFFGEKTCKASF